MPLNLSFSGCKTIFHCGKEKKNFFVYLLIVAPSYWTDFNYGRDSGSVGQEAVENLDIITSKRPVRCSLVSDL